ncbi:hypothetical protein CHUAL_009560 [Chamberlinius hualienensis]
MEAIRSIFAVILGYPSRSAMYRSVGCTFVGSIFTNYLLHWPLNRSILGFIVFVSLLANTGLANYLHVALMTLPRDASGLLVLIRFRLALHKFYKNNRNIPYMFKECAKKNPNKVMFYYENQTWTYKQAEDYVNRVASVFWENGYRHGDVVALFMESRPEFVFIWLGLAKIGVVAALVNFNLRTQSLLHSITTANTKALVFGNELHEAVADVKSSLPKDMTYYVCGGNEEDSSVLYATPLTGLLHKSSLSEPPKQEIKCTDPMVFIYTSGTTGFPKAAIITHLRFYFMTIGTYHTMAIEPNDIIYDALPLYHTMGGAMGAGQAICNGVSLAIRRKFSASQFWDDCIKYNCTVAQYIGEICRYLLLQEKKATEKSHKVRLVFGNGLRPQLWSSFVGRFGITNIREMYGATEGNANIVNMSNQPGAVGFISRIAPFAYPCSLIRIDEKTGEPIRNERGLCVECRPGEAGEFVGKIVINSPDRNFDGYVNKSASEKKIVRDVFRKGDLAFLSGDILVMDNYGYLYFKDRTGDTFRWKGENVSTAQVEAVISNIIGLKDCVVYGVEVPDNEGKAGMVSILDPERLVNLESFAMALQKDLPIFARPLFLRILETLPMTGTYKMKKVELQADGFDPAKCGTNRLYYLKGGSKYEPLTDQDCKAVSNVSSHFKDQIWTYKKMDNYSNRVANLFVRQLGYSQGDVVALLMDNRPEYLATWLGMAKIGVISALINYNLRKHTLAHSINVSNCKAVVFREEFTSAVDEVRNLLNPNVEYYVIGDDCQEGHSFAKNFSAMLSDSSTCDPPNLDIQHTDKLMYIYTSGTTGLPKPAVISHLRYYFIATCANLGTKLNENDRMYVPLPLYHSAGGIIGAGQALIYNVTVALRTKFSASQFWEDCIKYDCTGSQYIGETCRYLMAQPEKATDKSHKVRVMIGNGLRSQMWDGFVSRFNIKDIVELYGATEGNANMANLDNTKGAVGFQPRGPRFLLPYMLIKVDKTGQPIRDKDGLCIQCQEGEVGELIGRIDVNRTDRHYEGYINKFDSEKKILRNVFVKGDQAFASGDLLVMDRYGYFYFKDRTGDTFRWKGENVSTAEVEDVLVKLIGLKENVVYGVEVSGNEGRAGMAAIVDTNNTLDLNELANGIGNELPPYARPIFIRLTNSIPMTGTFKLKKLELQEDGFDPRKCGSDKLYYLNSSKDYETLEVATKKEAKELLNCGFITCLTVFHRQKIDYHTTVIA